MKVSKGHLKRIIVQEIKNQILASTVPEEKFDQILKTQFRDNVSSDNFSLFRNRLDLALVRSSGDPVFANTF